MPVSAPELLVGYAGRLSGEKGIPELLHALPGIIAAAPGLRFLIAGDGELRSLAEGFVQAQGLSDSVQLLGWVPHEKLPEFLNRLRLLVLPSHSEGLPNIAVEALSCGTPVVATSVGAVSLVVREGKTGFLLQRSTSDEIRAGVIRALSRTDLDAISTNATELIAAEFTFESCVRQWRSLIASMIDPNSSA